MEKRSQFERQDDFNPVVKCNNPIQETWVHKQVIKKVGETEDDFIIEEKPVLVDSVDIHKSIQEESKTTDLKYLLQQLMQTGDESVLQKRSGFYGDVTMFDEGHSLSSRRKVDLKSIRDQLPEEFKKLTDEQIAALTDEDIVKYYQSKIAEIRNKKEVKPVKVEEKKDGE